MKVGLSVHEEHVTGPSMPPCSHSSVWPPGVPGDGPSICPPRMSTGCVLAILVGMCIFPQGHQGLLLTLQLGPSLSSHLKSFLQGSLAEGLLLKMLHFVS